jgi:pyruvate/oxaloacetate carboxyltransferase
MSGEGYAQAGAATFDTAVSWITFGQEKAMLKEWREEDLKIAQQARGDALDQQRFENQHVTETFNWGKEKWGQEFGLTRKQINAQMKQQKAQGKMQSESFEMSKRREALDRMTSNLNNVLGDDIQMKQLVASRMGA